MIAHLKQIMERLLIPYASNDDELLKRTTWSHLDSVGCADVISNFKSRFPNAAFLASLGGATMPNPQGSGPAVNYNWPSQSGDCGDWISAATSSVSSLISSNNLDGEL